MCDYVWKFTGSQLRARIYTVNRADITKVQPWQFQEDTHNEEESDSEEEMTVVQDNVASGNVSDEREHESGEDEKEEVLDENRSDETSDSDTVVDGPKVLSPTRRGRQRLPPKYLEDYVWRRK